MEPHAIIWTDLHVGQSFVSPPHLMDVAQVKRFAGDWDPQLFHLDDEAAGQSLFHSLAASAWLELHGELAQQPAV